jgi:hypothetical protein
MIQRGDGARFALEQVAELFGGDFDGDITVEARISGAIHFAHASLAEQRGDLVRTEPFADGHFFSISSQSVTTVSGSGAGVSADRCHRRNRWPSAVTS